MWNFGLLSCILSSLLLCRLNCVCALHERSDWFDDYVVATVSNQDEFRSALHNETATLILLTQTVIIDDSFGEPVHVSRELTIAALPTATRKTCEKHVFFKLPGLSEGRPTMLFDSGLRLTFKSVKVVCEFVMDGSGAIGIASLANTGYLDLRFIDAQVFSNCLGFKADQAYALLKQTSLEDLSYMAAQRLPSHEELMLNSLQEVVMENMTITSASQYAVNYAQRVHLSIDSASFVCLSRDGAWRQSQGGISRHCYHKNDRVVKYAGDQSTSRTGRPCRRWDELEFGFTPSKYPTLNLEENHCRQLFSQYNGEGRWSMPGCYVHADDEVAGETGCRVEQAEGSAAGRPVCWEDCQVPVCSPQESSRCHMYATLQSDAEEKEAQELPPPPAGTDGGSSNVVTNPLLLVAPTSREEDHGPQGSLQTWHLILILALVAMFFLFVIATACSQDRSIAFQELDSDEGEGEAGPPEEMRSMHRTMQVHASRYLGARGGGQAEGGQAEGRGHGGGLGEGYHMPQSFAEDMCFRPPSRPPSQPRSDISLTSMPSLLMSERFSEGCPSEPSAPLSEMEAQMEAHALSVDESASVELPGTPRSCVSELTNRTESAGEEGAPGGRGEHARGAPGPHLLGAAPRPGPAAAHPHSRQQGASHSGNGAVDPRRLAERMETQANIDTSGSCGSSNSGRSIPVEIPSGDSSRSLLSSVSNVTDEPGRRPPSQAASPRSHGDTLQQEHPVAGSGSGTPGAEGEAGAGEGQ